MKTKNLILALVAIVFAVGSAFTSKNADLANNVYVKWKQTSTSNFICKAIPRECSLQVDGSDCSVIIKKADLTNETVIARDATCPATALKHSSATPLSQYVDAELPFDVE